MPVYPAICVTVLHNGTDESSGSLIQVAGLNNELRERVFMLFQEHLGKTGCAFFGLWIMNPDFIERFGERLRSPDFHISTRDMFDLLQDLPLPFNEGIPSPLHLIGIDADPAPRHVHETWKEVQFEVSDVPKVFFAKLNAKVVPEFEREFSIGFSVWPDVHSWHLPHFSLWIDTKLPSRLG